MPRIRRVDPETAEPRRERLTHSEDSDFEPRYLESHVPGERRRSKRNLISGVLLLLLCVPLFGWALYLGGPGVAMTLVSCLATVTTLYVISRSRLLRQRNGGFLALSLVCLVAVFVALIEQAWLRVAHPSTVIASAASEAASHPAAPASNTPPSLVEAFNIPAPDPSRGQRAKILKDSKVEIDKKDYILRAGDIFPFVGMNNDEAMFMAGSQQIALHKNLVEILDPQPRGEGDPNEDASPAAAKSENANPPSQKELAAQIAAYTREAIRRYPGIGLADAPENKAFVEKVNELKAAGAVDYFEKPDWPLLLADTLAKREGWKRQDSHVIEEASDEQAAAKEQGAIKPADNPKDAPSPDDEVQAKDAPVQDAPPAKEMQVNPPPTETPLLDDQPLLPKKDPGIRRNK